MADTCVSRVPIFAELSTDDQGRVARLARPIHLSEGEFAYSPGTAAQLMVVHTGRLKISRLSADGSEQLIRVLEPGEFTGETAVLSGRAPNDHASALDDCALCVFRHHDVAALVREHPAIGLRMLAAISERLSDTEHRLNALTTRGVESRLADYLLGLPRGRRDHLSLVTLPLAKKDVASLLDTTPESLSRALRSLAGKGVISIGVGRSVSITQPDVLQRIVDEE
jgi:CRP-like cAMP-binding protein